MCHIECVCASQFDQVSFQMNLIKYGFQHVWLVMLSKRWELKAETFFDLTHLSIIIFILINKSSLNLFTHNELKSLDRNIGDNFEIFRNENAQYPPSEIRSSPEFKRITENGVKPLKLITTSQDNDDKFRSDWNVYVFITRLNRNRFVAFFRR